MPSEVNKNSVTRLLYIDPFYIDSRLFVYYHYNILMLCVFSLFFLLTLVPVQAAIYFAHNVSENSGFVNTKKYWNGDSNLCWAATASNMLQWWQNNSSGIPSSVPNGPNESGRTEIYDVFCNNWKDSGKGVEIGLRWYLGGKPLNPNNYLYDFKDTVTDPKGTGRYWEGYVTDLGFSSSTWEGNCPFISSKFFTQDDFYLQVGTDLVSFFKNCCVVGLSIAPASGPGHAITCWGIEVDDATGRAKSLYITDSDNGQGLEKRDVYYNEDNQTLYLGSPNGYRINAYDALLLPFYNVPEPSAAVLIVLAAGTASFRRRRLY